MDRLEGKKKRRLRRKHHIRKRVSGTAAIPRLSVFRSNRHVYVQAIDDVVGHTLAAVSNTEKELAGIKGTVKDAGELGKAMAEQLKKMKIATVVFDRNGYRYHGIVKAVADGAREAGIRF